MDENGEIEREIIENILLFVPFVILLFWALRKYILADTGLGCLIWTAGRISFCMSLTIEILQLILRLGTWQISDLFYNTIGGVIGGIIYYLLYEMNAIIKKIAYSHRSRKM